MTLQEKFARLGTDNAPGQEGLQKDESLPMIGDKLEGPAVDFSHGDVNAHTPIPGSLEAVSAEILTLMPNPLTSITALSTVASSKKPFTYANMYTKSSSFLSCK